MQSEKAMVCTLVALLFFAVPALATHVAVLETTAAKDVVTFEEKQYLTDVLRSEAVKALPAEQNFVIMTREIVRGNMAIKVKGAEIRLYAKCLLMR